MDVDYTDDTGRNWRVRVPEGTPPDEYSAGIPIGPPAGLEEWLEEHGWAEPQRVALHNALHRRGIFTVRDVMQKPKDVQAALQSVLRTDMQMLQSLYYREAGGN